VPSVAAPHVTTSGVSGSPADDARRSAIPSTVPDLLSARYMVGAPAKLVTAKVRMTAAVDSGVKVPRNRMLARPASSGATIP
jgi:hypothetical protein